MPQRLYAPFILFTILLSGPAGAAPPPTRPDAPPGAADPRLVVEPFAAAPEIVHPVALDFDARGRLLVVESHTHFRPAKYAGPRFDRVRVFEDTDGDGQADRFTTFFEGTTATMDVAVHPDGSVYLATRNEVLRLRDTSGDGVADEKTRIAFLDTTGNYPHNGLAGLAFDVRGDLVFGMGENLGEPYRLTAADGTTIAGGGEGGNLFRCTADGKRLRRVATGFWNPFGAGFDSFGRLYVVDNDPDASPPCRLLRVLDGGDYGFQFRYGRSGRHPFQAWNGELPGTLPMAAGTGESPCEVVSYESDGLPPEYRGQLLVPVWADHRVERYVVRADGLAAERRPFVQGGPEFRPSGLAVAPDGSLFVSDWVSQSYELHGKGAIWRVRWKDAKPAPRSADPKRALASAHRPTRDLAARTLARDEAGRGFLRGQLTAADIRVRAAALAALVAADDQKCDLAAIARGDAEPGLRELAVRGLVGRGADVSAFLAPAEVASVRAAAVGGLRGESAVPELVELLADPDPYVRHAAVHRLGQMPAALGRIDLASLKEPLQRAGVLLAVRAAGKAGPPLTPADFLADRDPDVRLLAAKWIADEKLAAFRPQVVDALKDPALDPRGYLALATTLGRIDGRPVNEEALTGHFLGRLADRTAPAAARIQALRAVPATHRLLRTKDLVGWLADGDVRFRVEVLRALADRGDRTADGAVRSLATDDRQPTAVRAQAVVALAARAGEHVDGLIGLAGGADGALAREALRALVRVELDADQRERLRLAVKDRGDRAPEAARVLKLPPALDRPGPDDVDGWLKRLDGPADPEAGRRVFEHPTLGGCARCHRVDGRGGAAGPDLSLVGRTDRRWIVESILRPGAVVAPHFQTWKVDTADGRTRLGLLVRTYLDESEYVDEKGEQFKVRAGDGHEATPVRGTIMPDGLVNDLTEREVRDLVAYLASRR